MVSAMRRARRSSSSSWSNSRASRKVSSAKPSRVVEMCAPEMLAPEAAQAPANSASSRGWLGANSDSSVMAVKASVVKSLASFSPACSARAHELGVLDHLARVGPQPVVGIVPARRSARPPPRGQSATAARKAAWARGDAVARGELRVAARHHRLGLVVEPAQQLALPAVPGAGPDGADVGHGQHQQQLQPLRALHDVGEVADGLGVADVAAEGDRAHQQVVLDEPGDGLGLGRAQAEARAERARDARARPSSGPRCGPWRCRAGTRPRTARGGSGWS